MDILTEKEKMLLTNTLLNISEVRKTVEKRCGDSVCARTLDSELKKLAGECGDVFYKIGALPF